jgi:hypothetical protein
MQPGVRTFSEPNPLDDPVEFIEGGFRLFQGLLGCLLAAIILIVLLAIGLVVAVGFAIAK